MVLPGGTGSLWRIKATGIRTLPPVWLLPWSLADSPYRSKQGHIERERQRFSGCLGNKWRITVIKIHLLTYSFSALLDNLLGIEANENNKIRAFFFFFGQSHSHLTFMKMLNLCHSSCSICFIFQTCLDYISPWMSVIKTFALFKALGLDNLRVQSF